MNRDYVKPTLTVCKVMALENVSVFTSFEESAAFATDVTTYQFESGIKVEEAQQ